MFNASVYKSSTIDEIETVIENKKRIAAELKNMIITVTKEGLSQELKIALVKELDFFTPKNVSDEEYKDLLLEEWENNQLHDETHNKPYDSAYKNIEILENGRINIW